VEVVVIVVLAVEVVIVDGFVLVPVLMLVFLDIGIKEV
jgi:hypothetical protein